MFAAPAPPPQQPFRDAGYARADFHLSCQDVLFGARKAIDNRLLKLDEFNIQEYEYYEKVENGDWNYITPHFLAFASPVEPGYDGNSSRADGGRDGSGSLQPKISKSFRNVLEYFQMNGVKMVVRLNKKLYDERRFLERGMEHRESEWHATFQQAVCLPLEEQLIGNTTSPLGSQCTLTTARIRRWRCVESSSTSPRQSSRVVEWSRCTAKLALAGRERSSGPT